MTRPMTDGEVMDLIEGVSGDLHETEEAVKALREELNRAHQRISQLEERLDGHVQAGPYPREQS